MRRRHHLAWLAGLCGWALAHAAEAGPSVASINLCADQLLVHLADPGQIMGLSPYARDPRQSGVADRARAFPLLTGTAEEVLVLKPDLVLAGRFTKRATRDLLKAHGLRVVELDAVRSIEESNRQVEQVGRLLGQEARAASLVRRVDEAALRARAAAGAEPRTALPLQRRGWVSGGSSLMSSLLATLGLRNTAQGGTRALGGFASLETIVALRPDLLVVSALGSGPEDQGSALLMHPALTGLYPPSHRITIPDRFVNCGGPGLVEALDHLAAEVARVSRSTGP